MQAEGGVEVHLALYVEQAGVESSDNFFRTIGKHIVGSAADSIERGAIDRAEFRKLRTLVGLEHTRIGFPEQ